MFTDEVEKAQKKLSMKKNLKFDNNKKLQQNIAMRYMDMQRVTNINLAGQQQSVNNAENYPSTWSTNPDGGANGQV
jgi:hypothetical protein